MAVVIEMSGWEQRVQDLEGRIKVAGGHLNAAHAALVDLVAEALSTEAWAVSGIRSPRHWLTWQAGLAPVTAAQVLRLAEAKATHPAITAVFAEGRLSLDQAAIAVTAPAHVDQVMAELAPMSTVSQLRVEVRAATPAPEPVAPDDPLASPSESVSSWFGDDGRFHLRAELDPDRGRVVDAALGEARDRLFRDGHVHVTGADALVELAERSLDATPLDRRERFRVNVFIDPTADVPAAWGDGFAVPDSLRRLLTCEGTMTPTFVANGRPVSVAPSVRGIPDRTRRLVLARDKACRVPWCGRSRRLEVHHVVHREDGGATELANLAALCSSCHRQHHLRRLGIVGDAEVAGGLSFFDARGRLIDPAARPRPPNGPPLRPAQPYVHPLGERLYGKWLTFPDPPARPPPPAAA